MWIIKEYSDTHFRPISNIIHKDFGTHSVTYDSHIKN